MKHYLKHCECGERRKLRVCYDCCEWVVYCPTCGREGASSFLRETAVNAWNNTPSRDQMHRAVLALRSKNKVAQEEYKESADAAYAERNRLVAVLSKMWPASLEPHTGEDWGPDWQWVCIIDSPAGQISWHIKTSELPWFAHLPRNAGRVWDRHTTWDKYQRLASLPPLDASVEWEW